MLKSKEFSTAKPALILNLQPLNDTLMFSNREGSSLSNERLDFGSPFQELSIEDESNSNLGESGPSNRDVCAREDSRGADSKLCLRMVRIGIPKCVVRPLPDLRKIKSAQEQRKRLTAYQRFSLDISLEHIHRRTDVKMVEQLLKDEADL